MPRTLNLFAALLTVALPAVAQTHFCVGGDLDHLSPAEVTSCRAKMTEVREAVRRRGAPSGWHFLIVQPKRDVPTLQVADAREPDMHAEDNAVSGQ